MTALEAWLTLPGRLLTPARPDRERCVREGELHREARRLVDKERAAALAACVARIESARAAVFAADDGAVPRLMTDLEREWRTLSRKDPDGGLMDLWARITPSRWHDRKRWRGNPPWSRHEVAIALAADIAGVEAAEAAVATFRSALAAWGVTLGARIHWRATVSESECAAGLRVQPLSRVAQALVGQQAKTAAHPASEPIERVVEAAVLARWPGRPLLAEGIARAAGVDALVRAAAPADRPNPVTPLFDLWSTGYALVGADDSGVTLEAPAL